MCPHVVSRPALLVGYWLPGHDAPSADCYLSLHLQYMIQRFFLLYEVQQQPPLIEANSL